ncbi:hypothetical protein K4K52_003955 [Colletotrichum sp. SAR 10_76]|nr:hypothetical protein K4K51_002835 [Colletotrichum sp. SAR 10_75]KAI8205727.1 hypothetical protein K4K52_003955 [Colletotrichum sp. SAR 10_76]
MTVLHRLEQDNGPHYIAKLTTLLNDMDRLHRKRQQDREINEKTISALKCHIERHKSRTDTLGEHLSEDFFTSVRVVTETHNSNAQNVLRSINDAL